jgi:hypothetical protein
MRYVALVLVALGLAACNTFEDDAQRTNARTSAFSFPAAFTTADARIITERRSSVTGQDIVCTEPSPDVAKAISTAFALGGQGGNGSASGGLATSAGSAEAVAELAGRSTALLGLRDGLFRACEAYANGAIGADMYALIISHYGQLMTTLFLGQDITGIVQPTAVAQSPAISASATAAPGSSSGSPTASVTVPAETPPASLTGIAPTPASGAANALTRMNEDYLNLDYNIVHILAVACINQADPTIKTPEDPVTHAHLTNPWLTDVCNNLKTALASKGLGQLVNLSVDLVKGNVLTHPVDPTTTTTISSTPPKAPAPATKKTSPATSCPTPSAVQITEVQTALMLKGDLDSKTPTGKLTNGKLDSGTLTALEKFQTDQKITDPCTGSNGTFSGPTTDKINAIGAAAAAAAPPPAPAVPGAVAPAAGGPAAGQAPEEKKKEPK